MGGGRVNKLLSQKSLYMKRDVLLSFQNAPPFVYDILLTQALRIGNPCQFLSILGFSNPYFLRLSSKIRRREMMMATTPKMAKMVMDSV